MLLGVVRDVTNAALDIGEAIIDGIIDGLAAVGGIVSDLAGAFLDG